MKVLKFGGTSVGSPASLHNVKEIIAQQTEPVIVVVSAFSGVTDALLCTAHKAKKGDSDYVADLENIRNRHQQMVRDLNLGELPEMEAMLAELSSIYQGVFLIQDLSAKTEATIVSYGERLSTCIIGKFLKNAEVFDSRKFIKTEVKECRRMLATNATQQLIRTTWNKLPQLSLVPGFISTDVVNGEITNLGRGGSDYTASIIAATLGASALEIWTDVDGFMTADPRVISSAYVIKELSYTEAMELCNFGAKVVYPPTIYPACIQNIPIRIKNTFNPAAVGTTIMQHAKDDNRQICGISSIDDTTLITISGLSMVGVIGINRRIFSVLANNGISVFLVAQASSENSTSIGVRSEDAKAAVEVLNKEFYKEIEAGSMYPMQTIKELATVAVVGEKMKHTPGIAGKLFGALGRSGISVVAMAQGASETNISFVVPACYLRKTLNVLHDAFFLSEYQVLNLFLCGVGTVGGQLIQQIASQREKLMREQGLKLNIVGLASSKKAVFCRDGLDFARYKELLAAAPDSNVQRLRDEIIGMNIFNAVFVDCTASSEVANIYSALLNHNINVVTANKIAASSEYEKYSELKQTALRRGVKFLFETNVGAGLPIIRTINDLIHSGDKILKIEAVLSGTLNFIFNEISAETPFSKTVILAKEKGYSEPDPRIDLSGKDVIRKLVILSREAGYKINQEDVEANLFIPASFFEQSIETFWKELPSLDADFEQRRKALEQADKRWRFVARFENGKASVSLCEVPKGHPFYVLEGSNNIVMLTTERYHDYPMLIQGYGAGASVTAAGVFADIMSIANI